MNLFESARQAPLFLLFCICGIALGAAYDVLYVFRQKRSGVFMHISDFIFVLLYFSVIGICAYVSNKGKIEWFFFLAVLCGFLLERISIGWFIKKFIDFFAKVIYNLNVKLKESGVFKRLSK